MATLDASIVLIAFPAIFKGIGLNPLASGESSYFLWLLLGYMVVTATLLVTFGRISDMFGRVRLYNLNFLIFAIGSTLLALTPNTGNVGALELIIFRLIGLTLLPVNFNYPLFAVLIFVLGCGSGLFASPNTSSIMSSAPPETRGVSSGMRATFQNSATLVSIGFFFSIVTLGLASFLPSTLSTGLITNGVPNFVQTKAFMSFLLTFSRLQRFPMICDDDQSETEAHNLQLVTGLIR